MNPSSGLAALNAGKPSRSPKGTAMLAALSRSHIARGPAWERPGARPEMLEFQRCVSASFAPSATKVAAKLRRSQAIAVGLPSTCSRMRAAKAP